MARSRKEAHWIGLFFQTLERTGNVRLAAKRAGIDYTSAYARRKRDSAFAERWAAAIESAQTVGLIETEEDAAVGGELVVRDEGRDRVKLIKVGEGRWSESKSDRFLATLAATANVRRAAEAADISTAAVYARRLKDEQFREQWEGALETGKAKLEMMLVETAQRRFDPDALPHLAEDHEPPVSFGDALGLLRVRAGQEKKESRLSRWQRPRKLDDVRESILRKIAAIERVHDERKLANGWTRSEEHDCWIPPGWVRAAADEESASRGPQDRV